MRFFFFYEEDEDDVEHSITRAARDSRLERVLDENRPRWQRKVGQGELHESMIEHTTYNPSSQLLASTGPRTRRGQRLSRRPTI